MSSSSLLAIMGATGQLGADLVKVAAREGVDHVALRHEDVDVTDPTSLTRVLERVRPSVIVNTAAFHQVDRCEEDPGEAYRVNAVGALLVARAAKTVGARCVHLSTDYVFDGAREPGTAYLEGDELRPVNVYGASKAAGEQLLAQTLADHLVVRVSSLFGVAGARGKGGNFIEAILKKARDGGALKVVNDQWMTPTYTMDAAAAILRLALSDARGVVHVTNPEQCTWHTLACEAVRAAGLNVQVETASLGTSTVKARRPRNSALDTRRLTSLLGAPLRPWRAALRAYLVEKGHLN
jgi:dTDP-4-dehydrorhamnose reductase